jgi:DNA-binding transcriptional LysR family regulator
VELRHLRYFVAVAEELHFGRAAERVHIAQPPLSQQIRQLEEQIGVKLFHRTKRRVLLTHAGKIFLEEARQLLDLSRKAVQSARRADRGEIGQLVMGIVGSATYCLAPPVLRSFRERFPEVELILRELTTDQQLNALQRGSITIGFLRQPVRNDALYAETILREPFVVALPTDHALAAGSLVSLGMLATEPFIMCSRQEGATFYDQIMSLCNEAGFSPRVAQEAVQMPTVLGLVSVGIGIAIVPASVQNLQMTGVTYRVLTEVTQTTELAMAWRRDDESPVLRAFLAVAREFRASAPDLDSDS